MWRLLITILPIKKLNLFNIQNETLSIAPLLDAYPIQNNLRKGNFSARMRMSILYDKASEVNGMVIGTSNKSELMLGYGTLYGDLSSALNPIGDLYKSEVYELSEYLGVTKSIINKAPSADLWDGQSDEEDLGYTYKQLDEALKIYVEDRLSKEVMIKQGIDKDMLEMIIKRIFTNQFKRKMPLIAKLTSRTINHDFNYPRDIGL